jgi:hypothetical protein
MSSIHTRATPERVIFEDPLLRDIAALAMPAFVSAGDLLSLTALEISACNYDIPHDFSGAWQKAMTTSSIGDFIFACARGYGLDPSSLLKVTDDVNASTMAFWKQHLESKNRKYLEDILNSIRKTVLPHGPFEPDEAEILRGEIYGSEPHEPDMDFESEALYQWEEDMTDVAFRRSWEERVKEEGEKRELRREEEMKE